MSPHDACDAWLASPPQVPVSQQRLIYSREHLEDGRSLSSYGIQQGSTLNLALAWAKPDAEEEVRLAVAPSLATKRLGG